MTYAERSPSLAVLIDADNARARDADAIFDEIAKFGEANVRRIYGDFSGTRLAGWNKAIQSHAILQHQQRNNTTGKNAADIALVIDAMDLMHKGRLDAFCLISSDSDFTRLAQRLREDGLEVYGFGERKTPEAFRSACNRFIYVENLIENTVEEDSGTAAAAPSAAAKKDPPSKAIPDINKAMAELDDDDGWASLGAVGKRIYGIAPDFDPRSYGCPNLSTVVTKSGGFEMRKNEGGALSIRRKTSGRKAAGKSSVSNAK